MSWLDQGSEGQIAEYDARLARAGEYERVKTSATTEVRFVAPGSLTSGRFGLFRYEMAPGPGGAAPHFHTSFSESFYVLSGTVTLNDGRRWVSATEGSFLYVPERSVHGFRNDSDDAASMLILFSPAPPREAFFREIAEVALSRRSMSPAEWRELCRRHDQYMVASE